MAAGGEGLLDEVEGLLVVPDGGAVAPGHVPVGADQERAGLVDLAGAVPVVVEVIGSLSANYNCAQVR